MLHTCNLYNCGFLGCGSAGSSCNAGDTGDISISGSGRSHREVNGSTLQYSCLGNLMDEEPGVLQSKGSRKSWHCWETETTTYITLYISDTSIKQAKKKKVLSNRGTASSHVKTGMVASWHRVKSEVFPGWTPASTTINLLTGKH